MGDYENAVDSLDLIREYIERLSSPAEAQLRWMDEQGVPAVEMWDELLDAFPSWLPFMRLHIEVSNALEEAIRDLLALIEATDRNVWDDADEALFAPGWDVIRRRAAEVLACFDATS